MFAFDPSLRPYFVVLLVLSCLAQPCLAEHRNRATSLSSRLSGTNNLSPVPAEIINERVKGWVEQPDYRGSFDIIWLCAVTTFICTYSMLVLNIHAPTDSLLRIICRRVLWMIIAIIGPEFPLTYAAGQWSRACQSVEAFHADARYRSWSMRLAFFADMGGFVLHARDSTPFPLNAKQLHWLVVNEKVAFPSLSSEELWDKSKQDRFVKLIMAFQVGYFILQTIARTAQGLAVTTLELDTLAIVVCSLITISVWMHKPSEVAVPVAILSEYSIEEITDGKPWKLTPLDFIDDHSPGYSVDVQPFMKLPVISPERPIRRIPNDRFPTNPYGFQEYFLCLATLVFTGIHVIGWNFAFPSDLERTLWRISSMTLFGITATFWVLETIASWTRLGRWRRLYLKVVAKEKIPAFDERQLRRRETEMQQEPAPFPVPWEFWSIFPLALLYGVARFYLIIEAFLEFRNMPATAFINVDWAEYIPHL